MRQRSAAYKAALRYLIKNGGRGTINQVMLAMTIAIEPHEAMEAGIAHRERLAKRFKRTTDINRAFSAKLLALGERRIAWNTLERLKRNGRVTIDDPVNGVRLVKLDRPPETSGKNSRTMTWEEVLREIDE